MLRTVPLSCSAFALALGLASGPAFAQSTAAPPAAEEANADSAAGDIIVTARRRDERLQDVPQTIAAVTGENLAKFRILQFNDLDKVVSGLQLNTSGNVASVSARGVTFDVNSAAFSPTVAMYINDAPTLTSTIYQSLYDVGQIEFLRGPQGTTRGISSPSGSITFTTRKANRREIGGYGEVTFSDLGTKNIQGAVNIPLIQDVLAVRFSGLIDKTDHNGVYSATNPADPSAETNSFRVSLSFAPTDNITADVMYQRLARDIYDYGTPVFGTGAPGTANAAANYNGPPLGLTYRRTANAVARHSREDLQLVTGQINWEFAGQKLSYVGSYAKLETVRGPTGSTAANTLIGYNSTQSENSPHPLSTHEVRLSSVERLGGFLDYTVGFFHSNDHVDIAVNNGAAALLSGFFGAPGSIASPSVFNQRYELNTIIQSSRTTKETSFFGNLTAHVGDKLEISAGVRRISQTSHLVNTIRTSSAFIAQAIPANFCAGANGIYGATYANVCDIPIAAGIASGPTTTDRDRKPWVYQASLSYHVTPDLMLYASTGSSWREGPFIIGITNGANAADLNALTVLDQETSKSYEAGFKWTFMDRRARLNVSYSLLPGCSIARRSASTSTMAPRSPNTRSPATCRRRSTGSMSRRRSTSRRTGACRATSAGPAAGSAARFHATTATSTACPIPSCRPRTAPTSPAAGSASRSVRPTARPAAARNLTSTCRANTA